MQTFSTLDRRAIVVALMISVAAAFLVVLAWVALSLSLWIAAGEEAALAAAAHPLAHLAGLVVGLLPVLVGAIYLTRRVSDQVLEHCLVFGILSLTGSIVLALAFGDLTFAWHDVVYYLAIIPTALIGKYFGENA